MSALSAAYAVLAADATLLAAATGGVWNLDTTGRLGINRSNTATASAFDANKIIKPCLLVKLRSSNPDGRLADPAYQMVSERDMLEVWFWADNTYAPIETMRERVYALLQEKRLEGKFTCRWSGDVRGARDTTLDACAEKSDYVVVVIRST